MKKLLMAISALGVLWGAPAFVPQAAGGTQQPVAAQPTAGDAQVQPIENVVANGLQDIIVTSNRRSESVQRSSLAISVLGGDATLFYAVISPAAYCDPAC